MEQNIGEIIGSKVIKDQTENGLVYKNFEAFENKKGICYIPELTGEILKPSDGVENPEIEYAEAYTYDDFLQLVNGSEDMARRLFNFVDWQHPSSALEDFGAMGIIPCPNCGMYVDTEETEICPKCGNNLSKID